LDGASADPLADWNMINEELALYNPELAAKPQLVVLNKIDLPDAKALEPSVRSEIEGEGYPFVSISAVTGEGVRAMLYEVKRMADAAPVARPAAVAEPVIIRPPTDDKAFTIKRESNNTWR